MSGPVAVAAAPVTDIPVIAAPVVAAPIVPATVVATATVVPATVIATATVIAAAPIVAVSTVGLGCNRLESRHGQGPRCQTGREKNGQSRTKRSFSRDHASVSRHVHTTLLH
jgi:hypothetical protein